MTLASWGLFTDSKGKAGIRQMGDSSKPSTQSVGMWAQLIPPAQQTDASCSSVYPEIKSCQSPTSWAWGLPLADCRQ